MKRLPLWLGCATLAACSLNTPEPVNMPSDPATETFASGLGIDISQMQKVAVGNDIVYFKDLSVGAGAQLTTTGDVVVTYAAFLRNGSTFDSGTSVAFSLGQTVVGFRYGMLGMNVGGERVIVVPSNLGYGPYSVPPVPPNSTLIFDVRLEQILQ